MSLHDDKEDSDESLMARICGGDRQAFSQLVKRHNRRFYAIAYRVLNDRQGAEDVVQDAFVKLWQMPQKFNSAKGARFTTWFYRVVINLALDKIKVQKKVRYECDIDENPVSNTDGNAEETLIEKQQQEALEKAIRDLPERQQLALNLCFYEDVSNKDAAGIMGVSVKALEALLIRAKAGLRNHLIREGLLRERNHGT